LRQNTKHSNVRKNRIKHHEYIKQFTYVFLFIIEISYLRVINSKSEEMNFYHFRTEIYEIQSRYLNSNDTQTVVGSTNFGLFNNYTSSKWWNGNYFGIRCRILIKE